MAGGSVRMALLTMLYAGTNCLENGNDSPHSGMSSRVTGRELVNVLDHILDTSIHDSYQIEPEEYAWSKLSGLCCYDVNRPPCNVCKYWGSPDDFCHRSRGHCAENCSPRRPPDADGNPARDENGELLPELPPLTYCEGAPPPLIDGNKVCVGDSRLSEPCFDDLNSGKCTAFGVMTCQAYCWWTPGCAIFVVYSVLDSGDNRDGSCVLCYDLHNTEPTVNLRTRAYRYTMLDRALPPAPPSQPSPSPPPKPPPPPPPPLQNMVSLIAEDRLASCSFYAPYELVYTDDHDHATSKIQLAAEADDLLAKTPPSPPPGGAMADARVDHAGNATECCTLCATDEACQGFVFEEGSHSCVTLPEVRGQRLVPRYNAGMTAGFVRRYTGSSASPPPSPPPAQCTYTHDQDYSSGGGSRIGEGKPPVGKLMASQEVCCGACAVDAECVKFAFKAHAWEPGNGDCVLYRATAEAYVKMGEGLIAGKVMSRDIDRNFLTPPLPPHKRNTPMPSPPPTPPGLPGRMSFEKHPSAGIIDGDNPTGMILGAATSFLGAGIVICMVARWAMSSGSARQGKFALVKALPKPKRKARKAAKQARLAMDGASDDDEDADNDGVGMNLKRIGNARNEQLLKLMDRA